MIKKAFISLTLLLLFANVAISQNTLPIAYEYDAAGNRTVRKVIVLDKADTSNANLAKDSKGGIDDLFYSDIQQGVQMKIYPNPTKGRVTIEIQNAKEESNGVIIVYDSHGKRLISQSFFGISGVIDLTGFAKGYYIMELQYDGERASWKIIKE